MKNDIDYKRPDHNDFATSGELKQRKFSGFRDNKIAGYFEIWVDGIMKGAVRSDAPIDVIEKTIAEVFLLEGASLKE